MRTSCNSNVLLKSDLDLASSPVSRRLSVWAYLHLRSLQAVRPPGPLHPSDVLRVRPVVASVEVCVPAVLVPPAAERTRWASIPIVVGVVRVERLAEVQRHGIA